MNKEKNIRAGLFGIGIVFWGFVVAAIGFIRVKLHHHRVVYFLKEASKIRGVLGTYILFGLEFMIAGDITKKPEAYWILEINAAPGLDHYAKTGKTQEKIVEGLYLKVFLKLDR